MLKILFCQKTFNYKIFLKYYRIFIVIIYFNQAQFLTNRQNSHFFDILCLYPKKIDNFKNLKAIQMLSSIQSPSYIIHILSACNSNGDKRQHKFWLHRYNLKFTLNQQEGLVSDNFQGYNVDQIYSHHPSLPWGIFEKVNSLTLKKYIYDLKNAKNHEFLILIPDSDIEIQTTIKNPIRAGQNKQLKMLSYQIHDDYKDLRGKKRFQQLYLACLVASCFQPEFKILNMTNIQYSIHILRSVLMPKPLSRKQLKILQILLKISIQKNIYSLILMCKAIYFSSSILNGVLPIKVEDQMNYLNSLDFERNDEYIEECKQAYRKLKEQDKLSMKAQLNDLQLNILGMNPTFINKKYYSNITAFSKKYKLQCKRYQSGLQIIEKHNKIWSQIKQKKLTILKKMQASQFSKDNDGGTKQQIIKLQINQKSQMSVQYKQDIQDSLQSYEIIKNKEKMLIKEQKQIKQQFGSFYLQIYQKLQSIRKQIMLQIQKMQQINYNHEDIISNRRKIIQQIDFTSLLAEERRIYDFYPDIQEEDWKFLKQLIILWVKTSIEMHSQERILAIILLQENFDKVAFLREIESPRQQIQVNLPWLCFEVEMKSQIWRSQYQTYKTLYQNENGIVTQLNMGEGKTQIIIPMIVLNLLYSSKKTRFLPRVNILSPLYQEAQDNYYKFFSVTGFRISLISIYFNRQVKIDEQRINRMKYAADLFKNKSLIMMDRDSGLSMILKRRQHYGIKDKQSLEYFMGVNKKDEWIFRNLNILDIFDQVDALMTAKKSFVYSIGGKSILPESSIRFEYAITFLNIISNLRAIQYMTQNKLVILDENIHHLKNCIECGGFPKGFLLAKNLQRNKQLYFRRWLANQFFIYYLPPELEFYKDLIQQEKDNLIQYLINDQESIQKIKKITCIPHHSYGHLYAIRGFLAFGIIQHTLSMRNRVQYGRPGETNPKRLGCPYEAADVPSKRSQYSHPQVAILLSMLAYMHSGLQLSQFEEALRQLMKQPLTSRQYNYNNWMACILDEEKRPISVKYHNQINIESSQQIEELYEYFKFNRLTITYWLTHCVFPKDLVQYNKSITASSWDIAQSKHSLGFSGTKDAHWLFPTYIKLKKSQNHELNGTDGKMISLMIQNTIDVLPISQVGDDLWKRFCLDALKLKVGCIIDVGAILAGKSLAHEIVPWLNNQSQFKQLQYKGISFCNQYGSWKVYDSASHAFIERQSSIPEQQTFVIFDEARTRGADIKMKHQTIAALSLGPGMTKDKVMQAVGRLRKFGRNQKIYVLSTLENYKKIDQFDISLSVKSKIKTIINWTCKNSINDNQKMLYLNLKLAWTHFSNIRSKQQVLIQQAQTKLESMYKNDLKSQSAAIINMEAAKSHIKKYGQTSIIDKLNTNIQKYGVNLMIKCQQLQNVCERQIQMIIEKQQQQQKQHTTLNPEQEVSEIKHSLDSISTIDYKMASNVYFSNNFLKCTYYKNPYSVSRKIIQKNISTSLAQNYNNELCQVLFVYIHPLNYIMVITQREVNVLMAQGVQFIGPYSLNQEIQQPFITRFSDLNFGCPTIKQTNLEQALVEIQLFNGKQNFENRQLLVNTFKRNLNIKDANKKNVPLNDIVCHFLQRRYSQSKYCHSHLELLYKQLVSTLK